MPVFQGNIIRPINATDNVQQPSLPATSLQPEVYRTMDDNMSGMDNRVAQRNVYDQSITEGLTPAQSRAILAQNASIGTPFVGQEEAGEGLTSAINAEQASAGTTAESISNLANLGTDYYQGYMDKPSYTQASLEQQYPDLYEREQAIQAQNIGAESIDPYLQNVSTGSIDPYLERVSTGEMGTRGIDTADIRRFQDPYMQDVVDASLQDFDVGVDRASNLRRARQAGAGAFGGRQGLYDANIDAEQARQRGGLGAGLRSQAYQQALASATKQTEFGQRADMSDLERSLQAQTANQQTMLAGGQEQLQRELNASLANQANTLAGGRTQLQRNLDAQRYNQAANLQGQETTAKNIMNRKLQDATLAYQGDTSRLSAIDAQRQLQLQRAGLGSNQAEIAQRNAALGSDYGKLGLLGSQQNQSRLNQLYEMGGGQFTQPLQLLTLGQGMFGEKTDLDRESTEQLDQQKKGSESSMGFSAKF